MELKVIAFHSLYAPLTQPRVHYCCCHRRCQVPTGPAIIVREYLHGFFLQDLSDPTLSGDDEQRQYFGQGGTGYFDVMSSLESFGAGTNARLFGHLSPYSRHDAGWLDYVEITQDGVYPIQPSEFSSLIYQIKTGFADGEYILIENRQQVKWDEVMPASGIVMYHVDESKPDNSQAGYPGHENWPEAHYRVSVIQQDGLYEIEQGINNGDANDYWGTAGMVLGPGPQTFPNTDSYTLGRTGITITIMTDSSQIMLFKVEGLGTGRAAATMTAMAGAGVAASSSSGDLFSNGPVEDIAEIARPDPTIVSNVNEPDSRETSTNDEREPARYAVTWIMSMLGGVAVVMGLMTFLMPPKKQLHSP
jgi:hypothetical protein